MADGDGRELSKDMVTRKVMAVKDNYVVIRMNLVVAREFLKSTNRGIPYRLSSTLTPHQMCGSFAANESFPLSRVRIRSDRLVRTW